MYTHLSLHQRNARLGHPVIRGGDLIWADHKQLKCVSFRWIFYVNSGEMLEAGQTDGNIKAGGGGLMIIYPRQSIQERDGGRRQFAN